jgi:transcriptional regulator with GAF, ATPase, and Fis domain
LTQSQRFAPSVRVRDFYKLPVDNMLIKTDGAMISSPEAERFRTLYELGCAFSAKTELADLIPYVIEKCRETLNAEAASVLLLDRDRNELYFPYVADLNENVANALRNLRLPADKGIAGAALSDNQTIVVNDAQNDPRLYRAIDRQTGAVTRNLIATPLQGRNGVIGVLEVLNRRDSAFDGSDAAFLEAVSESIAIAIENANLYAQLRDSEAILRTQVGVLRRDLAKNNLFTEIVGSSAPMLEVFQLMEAAAASSIAVMIQGDTGTGKELVARGIHRASARCEAPFVAVNCAAMPETLLESELFGHRKGSFTGAIRDSPGVFRAASGGVVFLDEVTEMPLRMQAKLLRVLEQEEVIPVGETFPVRVDVRIISATNRDLKAEVAANAFREDLYYRLAAFPIELPRLRDRREDIESLASRFLTVSAERHHKRVSGFDPAVLSIFANYDWPGNVRQLRNEIDRAVAMVRDGATIGVSQLSPDLRAAANRPTPIKAGAATAPAPVTAAAPDDAVTGRDDRALSLREARAEFEAAFINEALARHHGNVSRAAQALGISRPALQEKIKTYHLR